MQPDESKPGGITDSVISGDVHYHNTTQTGMQPSTIIIDPNTGMPQNVIIMQQPSAGPKVVGILIIIWGVLGIGNEVLSIGTTLEFGGLFILFSIINSGIAVGFIVGGAMMTNYQMRGIQISLAMIVVTTIVGLAVLALMPGLLDDFAEDEDLTSEERELLDDEMSLVMGIGAIFILICNGICGLIIAIPLMISNNGLDKSSLFS